MLLQEKIFQEVLMDFVWFLWQISKNLRNPDHENGIFRTENQLSEIIIVTYPSEVRQDTSSTNDISFGTHKLIKLLPLTVEAVFPEKYSFNFYKN